MDGDMLPPARFPVVDEDSRTGDKGRSIDPAADC